MFKSQCSHMWLQKSILSHVTTLTFVVTCDYIDFFLANVTVNHNVHTFTIIVHGYLFHSFLINVLNYNEICRERKYSQLAKVKWLIYQLIVLAVNAMRQIIIIRWRYWDNKFLIVYIAIIKAHKVTIRTTLVKTEVRVKTVRSCFG